MNVTTPIVTSFDYNDLLNGGIIVHGNCRVAVYGHEFAMRKPSGHQKFDVADTDVDTLNGAWLEFNKEGGAS